MIDPDCEPTATFLHCRAGSLKHGKLARLAALALSGHQHRGQHQAREQAARGRSGDATLVQATLAIPRFSEARWMARGQRSSSFLAFVTRRVHVGVPLSCWLGGGEWQTGTPLVE